MPSLQGFEEGHMLPCSPIHGPGFCLHGVPSIKDSNVERIEVRARLADLRTCGPQLLNSSQTPYCTFWDVCSLSSY